MWKDLEFIVCLIDHRNLPLSAGIFCVWSLIDGKKDPTGPILSSKKIPRSITSVVSLLTQTKQTYTHKTASDKYPACEPLQLETDESQ